MGAPPTMSASPLGKSVHHPSGHPAVTVLCCQSKTPVMLSSRVPGTATNEV